MVFEDNARKFLLGVTFVQSHEALNHKPDIADTIAQSVELCGIVREVQQELVQIVVQVQLGEVRIPVTANAMQLNVNVGLDLDSVTVRVANDEAFVVGTASVDCVNDVVSTEIEGLSHPEYAGEITQRQLYEIVRTIPHCQQP